MINGNTLFSLSDYLLPLYRNMRDVVQWPCLPLNLFTSSQILPQDHVTCKDSFTSFQFRCMLNCSALGKCKHFSLAHKLREKVIVLSVIYRSKTKVDILDLVEGTSFSFQLTEVSVTKSNAVHRRTRPASLPLCSINANQVKPLVMLLELLYPGWFFP